MTPQRQPAEQTLSTDMFGRSVSLSYSETWVGYSLLGLRVVMAWIFLQAGLEKWSEGGWGDPLHWSSEAYLNNAVAPDNPLIGVFEWFAEYASIVDPLVLFGQILIGLALLFGVFLRFAALMGSIQMLMFWTAAWQDGILAGLPMEHGFVIDSSFVYLVILFGLGAWGAGRVLGIDAVLEKSDIVRNNPWLRYLLG